MPNHGAFPLAFPRPASQYHGVTVPPEDGMTLRDYFAGQAMQGAIAQNGLDMHFDVVARLSYDLADAMLEEREK